MHSARALQLFIHWGSSVENYAEMLFQLSRGQWSNTMKQSGDTKCCEHSFIRDSIHSCQRGLHCPRGQAQGRRNLGVRGQRGPLYFWSKPFSLKMDILLLLDWSPPNFLTIRLFWGQFRVDACRICKDSQIPPPSPHRKKGFGHLLKNVAIVNQIHFSVSIGGYQKIKNKHFIHIFLCKVPGNKHLTQKRSFIEPTFSW